MASKTAQMHNASLRTLFRRVIVSWVLVGAVVGCLRAQSTVVDRAKHDVAVLTADSLFGRGYEQDGADRAGQYLRSRFQSIGLEAVGDSYFQQFPVTVDAITQAPSLIVNGDSLEPGESFIPHGITGGGEVEKNERIVSVGTGLVVPSKNINPYGSVDVEGSVVVIEEEVPPSIRSDSTLARHDWSILPRIAYAARQGAAAVVVLADRLIFAPYPHDMSIPVLLVQRKAWPETVRSVSLGVDLAPDREYKSQNVIGRIPGGEKPDSLIILSAHYDHVGSFGRQVYFPGANDNASGTAMILALARQFQKHPLPYTVICIAFSGEEVGLVGSSYFAEHPPIDLSRVKFLLNFDMVASGTEGIMAVGGVDFPEAFRRLEEVNDSLGLGPLGKRKNTRNSDHYPLTQKSVPGFFLYTRGGEQPYHHVDDAKETLDWEPWSDVYTLAVHFLMAIDE